MKTFDEHSSSGYPHPADNDYENTMTATDEAEMFDNGPKAPKESMADGAVKGAAWLLGIFGVFAVAILLAWVIDMNHSPFASVSSRSVARPVATASHKHLPSTAATVPSIPGSAFALPSSPAASPYLKVVPANPQLVAIVVPVQAPSLAVAAPAPTAVAVKPLATSAKSAASASTLSASDQARIEKEALEVIHGDFGNNPGRRAKLGSDYAAVQAKVNELLHI